MTRVVVALVVALVATALVAVPALAVHQVYYGQWSAVQTFPGVIRGDTRQSAQWEGPVTGDLTGTLKMSVDYTPPDIPLHHDRTYITSGVWRFDVTQDGTVVGQLHGTVTGKLRWNATGSNTFGGHFYLVVTGGTGLYRGYAGQGQIAGVSMTEDGTIMNGNLKLTLEY